GWLMGVGAPSGARAVARTRGKGGGALPPKRGAAPGKKTPRVGAHAHPRGPADPRNRPARRSRIGPAAETAKALLACYDFPAEHWKHLRTSNPIESTFATVRHRTIRAKGCLSNKTALAMVFKLVDAAQKSWRRLDGHNQLPKLIQGVTFTDAIQATL